MTQTTSIKLKLVLEGEATCTRVQAFLWHPLIPVLNYKS